MLRSLIPFVVPFLWAAASHGAILPDQVGELKKGPVSTVSIPDRGLYDEYGLDTTEQAEYGSGKQRLTATLWRFRDSTGAMAMFEARRPALAVRTQTTKLAVRTSDGVIFAYGNYVFQVTGPLPADLSVFYANLPKLEQSALPALYGDLPADGLIPNSERYIVGPVSLDRFLPGIAPSVAAFHVGAEAQVGKYTTEKGTLTLAIFNYPTPNMARDRLQEFQKIPGTVAKRAGPLLALTINPPDADAAERILSQVKYDTNITWNEGVPQNEVRHAARYILNIFVFSGILIALCATAGLMFGGARLISRRLHKGEDPQAMITLHLGGK